MEAEEATNRVESNRRERDAHRHPRRAPPPRQRPTVDRREAAALEQVLRNGTSTMMEPKICRAAPAKPSASTREGGSDALRRYDDNRNGRITSKEARRHAIAPVHRSHPAYRFMRDGDGDGVVCE